MTDVFWGTIMDGLNYLLKLLEGGAGNLAAYLAAHILLCLIPAFYIAGAMTALIPKNSITGFLGRNTPKYKSYPAAVLAASLLAVCSCTIVPLFAGIYKKGAGIGPAITFLFFAPAANILALLYTSQIIGPDLALARFVLSLIFGIGIGMIMALVFSRDDAVHDGATDAVFAGQNAQGMRIPALLLLVVLVAILLAGTLKIGLLSGSYFDVTLPIPGVDSLQGKLDRLVPHDDSRGEEGVSVQGVILIGLLLLMGAASWKGLENIFEGFNNWVWASLGLVAVALLVAALGMKAGPAGLQISVTGRFFAVLIGLIAAFHIGGQHLSVDERRDFLWESWKFVKEIFPLLLGGVFIVGVIRVLIRPEWIEGLAGQNSLAGNLAGVLFGVFMYFPTLVEVPIAKMFLDLGMHRGPLLAYLMADPELSLQSMLIISTVIGRKKTMTYVGLVALFSTAAGLAYGKWVDGASVGLIASYLLVFLGLLSAALWRLNGRRSTIPD
jgi:uncharacterized membrane protein YraQ (UPF0718 family)